MTIKYIYRSIYNLIKSRRLRIMSLKTFELFNLPFYRFTIDTNNICNLRCIMCYMSLKDFRPEIQIMPIDLFESIAQQTFRKIRILDLSCGFEPFMTKNFLDYARIARRLCKGHISVCTNGLLMNERIIEDIVNENLFDEINISIDGITESTYNSIRINGNFAKIISVLESLKERKEKTGGKKPVIRVNYTMLSRNIEELKDVYEFVKKYDIKTLQLRHAKLTKPFSDLFNESLFFHQELSDSVIRKVKEQFDNDKSRTLIHPHLFSDSKHFAADKGSCAYPWFYFIISSNGNVNMCNIGSIGNFTEYSFENMLDSDFVKNSRYKLLKGDYKNTCKHCYTISDLGDITQRDSFIREDLMPDRVSLEK